MSSVKHSISWWARAPGRLLGSELDAGREHQQEDDGAGAADGQL
jgi:hypothetical protein